MMDEYLLLAVIIMLVMADTIDWGGGWTWPVPDRPGSPALVTNPFKRPAHLGVDIMYREGGQYVAPVGTPVLAARAGVVWSTGKTARGQNVVLDHGAPFATFYQHLETVSISKGQRVEAGQQIGTMGADPTDPQGLRHLHFAVWYKGNGDSSSVDPGRAMPAWRRSMWT